MTERERELWKRAGTVRLRVSRDEARNLLQQVKHEGFQRALDQHWQFDRNGNIKVQSICWLFCWAATGNSSLDTADECRGKFDKIFDHSYTWFDSNIGLEVARKCRYYGDDHRVVDLRPIAVVFWQTTAPQKATATPECHVLRLFTRVEASVVPVEGFKGR